MRLLCFDVETTGVDVHNDRIVQAFLGLMEPDGQFSLSQNWLLDPGVEIPTGASDVHGITTAIARERGLKDVRGALEQMRSIILSETGNGAALVIFNAPYDTTLLNAELVRHGLAPIDFEAIFVVDPFVIDKGIDKYRKGSRKLVAMAAHYGVPVEENAHDAGADCLMTGRIALTLLAKTGTAGLQQKQKAWKLEQATSFQKYLRSAKNPAGADPTAYISPEWPVQSPTTPTTPTTLTTEGVAA